MPKKPTPQAAQCPRCGQSGVNPPGLSLSEYESLEGVFVVNEAFTDIESVPTPQRLTCRSCGHSWAVARGSIEVRKA